MPNRIATYLVSIAALCAAVLPALANFDVTSTVGIVGGVGALALIVAKWLDGWQKYEERTDLASLEEKLAGAARKSDEAPAPPIT